MTTFHYKNEPLHPAYVTLSNRFDIWETFIGYTENKISCGTKVISIPLKLATNWKSQEYTRPIATIWWDYTSLYHGAHGKWDSINGIWECLLGQAGNGKISMLYVDVHWTVISGHIRICSDGRTPLHWYPRRLCAGVCQIGLLMGTNIWYKM